MRTELLIIDPQKDFCCPRLNSGKPGALYVEGADKDAARLAAMISRLDGKIDDIHVTLDSHHKIDIAHPLMWVDGNGRHPAPFTLITDDDVAKGLWTTTNPAFMPRAATYVRQLRENGRYPLYVWPEHCLIGSEGAMVEEGVHQAILAWEDRNFAMADFVTKGSNFWTEHYSAVQADVPDATDPGTQLNTRLIQVLEQADDILITGEALSHCVANTIRDIAANFGQASIRKFILLQDTTSNVQGFENIGREFVDEMTAKGMRTAKSTDIYT